MLRRLLTLVLLLTGLWLPVTAQAAKSYQAERYAVQIAVQTDGSLAVTETIVFRFDGGPFTYVFRELAYTELDGIDQVQAALDGQTLTTGTGPGQAEIEPGQPLKVTWHLPPTSDATHTFTLTYRVQGALRQEGADVLRWRAIPEEHDYHIQTASVTLTYPAGLQPLETPTLSRSATPETMADGVGFVASDLDEDEDLIITARFPAGSLITAPPAWQTRAAARAAATARAWPFGLVVGLITALSGGLGLWAIGRADRRDGVVEAPTPSPIPPRDLPPALVGRLTGQSGNSMGTLFDLARRGRLEIHEQTGWLGTKSHLLELKPSPEPLRPHEQVFLEVLFKPGQTTLALSEVAQRLAARPLFDQQLEAELIERGWLDPQRRARRTTLVALGLAGLVAALGVFIGGAVWAGLALEAAAEAIGPMALIGLGAGLFLVALGLLLYAGALSQLTPAGELEAARWKGFGLYLKEISRGREPITRADDFERYLALAAVFGLGAEWAKHFQKLGNVPLPVWFHAAANSSGDFGAIVAVMASSDSSSAASAAGGAGASGGGSSGAG